MLFVKVLDVDADGKAKLIRNLIAPVRVPDVRKPFTVTMPGFVHRFESGHTRSDWSSPAARPTTAAGWCPTPVSIPPAAPARC